MERVQTSSLPVTSKYTRSFLERSTLVKTILKVVGVLGVSLVMSGKIRLMVHCYATEAEGVL